MVNAVYLCVSAYSCSFSISCPTINPKLYDDRPDPRYGKSQLILNRCVIALKTSTYDLNADLS
jgi:hypothetical protein